MVVLCLDSDSGVVVVFGLCVCWNRFDWIGFGLDLDWIWIGFDGFGVGIDLVGFWCDLELIGLLRFGFFRVFSPLFDEST